MSRKKWIIVIIVAAILTPLIAFMIASAMIKSKTTTIVLPEPEEVVNEPEYSIELTIYAGGKINCVDNETGTTQCINIQERDMTPLSDWINSLGSQRLDRLRDNDGAEIVIRADKGMPYQEIEPVFELLQELQIKRFALLTNIHA